MIPCLAFHPLPFPSTSSSPSPSLSHFHSWKKMLLLNCLADLFFPSRIYFPFSLFSCKSLPLQIQASEHQSSCQSAKSWAYKCHMVSFLNSISIHFLLKGSCWYVFRATSIFSFFLLILLGVPPSKNNSSMTSSRIFDFLEGEYCYYCLKSLILSVSFCFYYFSMMPYLSLVMTMLTKIVIDLLLTISLCLAACFSLGCLIAHSAWFFF